MTSALPPPPILPAWLKVFLVLFSCTLAVYNARMHGLGSLLYICNVALFIATIGICFERQLLVSMAAVGVIAIQLLWVIDLTGTLIGTPIIGMTDYMLGDALPLVKRLLSLFHAWLPMVLLFALWRLGYRKEALPLWTALTWIVLLISYFFLPAPPAPADAPLAATNVNYVYGLHSSGPQSRVPAWAWLGAMMVVLPLVVFYPSHLVFTRCFARANMRQPSETVQLSKRSIDRAG